MVFAAGQMSCKASEDFLLPVTAHVYYELPAVGVEAIILRPVVHVVRATLAICNQALPKSASVWPCFAYFRVG